MLFVENEKDAGNYFLFFFLVGANWAANLLIFRLVYSCVTLNNKKYLSTHPTLPFQMKCPYNFLNCSSMREEHLRSHFLHLVWGRYLQAAIVIAVPGVIHKTRAPIPLKKAGKPSVFQIVLIPCVRFAYPTPT